MLTAEDKTNIFKKLGYGQKAMLDLNLIELIEATEQALLAKLQPEGMEKIEDELALALSRAEYCPTKEQTDCSIGSNCDRCEAKFVLAKLSPYLLQAKEEELERIKHDICWEGHLISHEKYGHGYHVSDELWKKLFHPEAVLSSPATEKENK